MTEAEQTARACLEELVKLVEFLPVDVAHSLGVLVFDIRGVYNVRKGVFHVLLPMWLLYL